VLEDVLEDYKRLELLQSKTLMFSPAYLVKNGIPVTRAIQKPGHFIVTFPRAYHSGFSHGLNCAEAVNFALDDSFFWAKEARDVYRITRFRPVINADELAFKALEHIVKWTRDAFKKLQSENPGETTKQITKQVVESSSKHFFPSLPTRLFHQIQSIFNSEKKSLGVIVGLGLKCVRAETLEIEEGCSKSEQGSSSSNSNNVVTCCPNGSISSNVTAVLPLPSSKATNSSFHALTTQTCKEEQETSGSSICENDNRERTEEAGGGGGGDGGENPTMSSSSSPSSSFGKSSSSLPFQPKNSQQLADNEQQGGPIPVVIKTNNVNSNTSFKNDGAHHKRAEIGLCRVCHQGAYISYIQCPHQYALCVHHSDIKKRMCGCDREICVIRYSMARLQNLRRQAEWLKAIFGDDSPPLKLKESAKQVLKQMTGQLDVQTQCNDALTKLHRLFRSNPNAVNAEVLRNLRSCIEMVLSG